MKRICLYSNKGVSLLEVTIAIGIMGIMAFAFSSMITQQQKQIQRLEAKSTLLELQTLVVNTLMKQSNCTNQLLDPALGVLKMDGVDNGKVNLSSATTDSSSPLQNKIRLNKILMGDSNGSSVLMEVGRDLPGLKNQPINEIYISDFVRKSDMDDTLYVAHLYAKFSGSSHLNSLKPIKVKMNIKTDNTGITARGIASCSSGDDAIAGPQPLPIGTKAGYCQHRYSSGYGGTGFRREGSLFVSPAFFQPAGSGSGSCECEAGWTKVLEKVGDVYCRCSNPDRIYEYSCIKTS